MASFWFAKCFTDWMGKTATALDLDADTIKISLWKTTFSPAKTNDTVSDLTPATYELSCTNYTGGHGGSGRKTLATAAVSEEGTGAKAVFDASVDPVWAALGPGDTVGAAVIHKAGASDDTTAYLICQLDISPDVTANGGDFTIQFATPANGGICYVAI